MINVALGIVAILFFVLYLVFSFYIYKKKEMRKFDLRNSFAYELYYIKQQNEKTVNVLLIVSLVATFANSVLYTSTHFGGQTLISTLILLMGLFCFGALSIIPLKKLKEHFICVVLSFVGAAALGMLNLIMDLAYYRLEYNNLFIISMIVDSVVLVIGTYCLLNPKIVNLNLQTDEEGNLVRPKILVLAFSEWLVGIALIISQISVMVISMI